MLKTSREHFYRGQKHAQLTQSLVVVEVTIRIREQPGNENDLELSTTIAGKLETTKTQLSPPDQVLVNISDCPYQPKNFKDLREKESNKKIISKRMV